MISRKDIQRESFRSIGETCPAVDRAFSDCIDAVKEQTGTLREALESWIERALEAEEKIESLRERVKELEAEIEQVAT